MISFSPDQSDTISSMCTITTVSGGMNLLHKSTIKIKDKYLRERINQYVINHCNKYKCTENNMFIRLTISEST